MADNNKNIDPKKQAVEAYKNSIKQAESGGNVNAKSSTSSARGLYQFTDATWKEMEKKLGKKLDITSSKDQEVAMNKLTDLNIATLEKNNLPVTQANLYTNHFLGLTGGPKFLKNLQKNPNELASKYVSAAAVKSNESLFYKNEKPVTAAELFNNLNSKVESDSIPTQIQQVPQYIPSPEFNNTEIDNTSTQKPRLDTNLKLSNQSIPKSVTDNQELNISPVDTKNQLGLSGNLDFLPSDINLAFSEEEQLNQELSNPDELVNIAKDGGIQDSIDPKKKKLSVTSKNDPRYLAYNDSLNAYNSYKNLKDNFINTELPISKFLKTQDFDKLQNENLKNKKIKPTSEEWLSNKGREIKANKYKKPNQEVIIDSTPTVNNIDIKSKPLELGNTDFSTNIIKSYPEAKIPQYYNVIDDRGKSSSSYRYYPQEGQELPSISPKNVRKMTPVYEDLNKAEYGGRQNNLTVSEPSNKILEHFNEGGSHEENKYGGIPQGIGFNGKLNTVEEGETKFNNYVFSDTLKLNDDDIESLFLPKEIANKTFAEASKYINSILEDNPNDKIIKKTVEKQLDSLTLGNEKARLAKEQLDINLGKQSLNKDIIKPVNEMFLGGITEEESIGNSIGMSGLQPGLESITDLIQGNKDRAISNGITAGTTIAGTAIGGPIGGQIGSTIGKIAGSFIDSNRMKKKQQELNKIDHINNSNIYQNDFKVGGDLTDNKGFPYGDEYAYDPLTANYRQPENLDPNSTLNLGSYLSPSTEDNNYFSKRGNLSTEFTEPEIAELNNNKKTNSVSNPKSNVRGKNYAQYAPVLGDFLNYRDARRDKAEVENLNSLTTRFNPNYADETFIQNLVGNDYDNSINSLTSATNGSTGALRANILGAGANRTKALSDAYFKIDDINRQQDLQGQQFNLGIDQFNIGQDNQERDINARNRAAIEDRRRSTRDTLFRDIGAIGREQTYDNRLANLTGGYDSMGNYNPDNLSLLDRLKELGLDSGLFGNTTNTKKQGGILSSAYSAINENKMSNFEKEFNKRYK